MSPFKSERQRKFMHKNMPEMAERWEKEEKSGNYKKKKSEHMMDDMPRKHAKRMEM